jgi:hypothetical protein
MTLTPGVQDGDGALDDGAVLQAVDVSGVQGVGEVTDLGAGPVAGYALAVFGLQLNQEFIFFTLPVPTETSGLEPSTLG